jgi:hypothetical protein
MVRLGSAPLLAFAWKVTVHNPAGNVVAPVQVPLRELPEANESGTFLPATVAVTALAMLLTEE